MICTCGGLCACVFEVMFGTGMKKKTGSQLTRRDSHCHKVDEKQKFISRKDANMCCVLSVSVLSQSTSKRQAVIFKEHLRPCTHSWQSCTCRQKQKHTLVSVMKLAFVCDSL